MTLRGTRDGGLFGIAFDVLDDFDGDGVPELAVSGTEDLGFDEARARGYVQVLSGVSGVILWERQGVRGDQFGVSVEALGDVDGDGFTDIAVGGPQGAFVSDGPGFLRVFSGVDGTQLLELSAGPSLMLFARSITALGDVNGDSKPDFAVGSILGTHVFSSQTP